VVGASCAGVKNAPPSPFPPLRSWLDHISTRAPSASGVASAETSASRASSEDADHTSGAGASACDV
jgi:hypothetical protein